MTRALRPRRCASLLVSCALALFAGCGGGGGTSQGGTLPGVALVSFSHASADNVSLNTTLEFRFSSPIDPASIDSQSIQIRGGPTFGQNTLGRFIVSADRVFFEPALPGLCDLSDAGFRPGTEYRVTFVGHPETFAIRNLGGDPLAATIVATFRTRPETDPDLFRDHVPGEAPFLVSSSPVDGTFPLSPEPIVDAIRVRPGNAVVLDFSENLDPCSITDDSVFLAQYEVGDPTLGFVPAHDLTPLSPYVWGGGSVLTEPVRIRCTVTLDQSPLRTRLTLRPVFDRFPDNALLVATITNGVRDLLGTACVPATVSFVTENLPPQTTAKTFEFTGQPGDFQPAADSSTADVSTARSPGVAQGWLLFAGDGDNGVNLSLPSGPQPLIDPVDCLSPAFQANDSRPDDFDPASDISLSSGASLNQCFNSTDGSKAVVFEFRSFRVRSGVTVRITGSNPVIFLVSGSVLIEAGGRVLARGDAQFGSPQSNGENALNVAGTGSFAGGVGVAGGGSGGASRYSEVASVGDNGSPGVGSPDVGLPAGSGITGPVLVGAGRGAGSVNTNGQPNLGQHNRNGIGGGGGGHTVAGGDGGAFGTGTTPWDLDVANPDGKGGASYGTTRLEQAEAGSGGGGGGSIRPTPWAAGRLSAGGGGGGAGGGFVDFTAGGSITVLGEIDAAGGRGGGGANDTFVGAGGGGGGSGGGIRMLTPHDIVFGATTRVTAAGGAAGTGGMELNPPAAPVNNGGRGSDGRIVLEDSDSIVTGLSAATLLPSAGAAGGFFRGVFDATRFKGGGLRPVAISEIIDVGPLSPSYLVPSQDYLSTPVPAPGTPRLDFVAGIPQRTSTGINRTGIYIEARGYDADAKGVVLLSSVTPWVSVGSFVDSGFETQPTWMPGVRPADQPVELDSTTGTLPDLEGKSFLQLRITFYLVQGSGPEDPGPYLDKWDLWFQHDQ